MTIFWDIPKWNRRQTNWNRGSIQLAQNLTYILRV